MTEDEQRQEMAARRQRRVDSAWFALSTNKDLDEVLSALQLQYGAFLPAFREGDGYNSHAASRRDGNREVLNEFLRKLAQAKRASEKDDSAPRQTETTLEFTGGTP
jgi:hypothetical protein